RERRVHVVWVDESECTGCNLCAAVCPVPDCITMTDVTNGKPVESWNDRIQRGTAVVPGGLDDWRSTHGGGAGHGGDPAGPEPSPAAAAHGTRVHARIAACLYPRRGGALIARVTVARQRRRTRVRRREFAHRLQTATHDPGVAGAGARAASRRRSPGDRRGAAHLAQRGR